MDESASLDIAWPRPRKPASEIEALARFHRDVTWSGVVYASGSIPEMTAVGSGTYRRTPDGLWIIGAFEQDQFFQSRKVTSWQAHYVAGWDVARRCYVVFAGDSNGRSASFTGAIEGDLFTIVSDVTAIDGTAIGLRMVWDATDPETMRWRNEMSFDGGPWTLVESYDMQPI